MTHDHIPPVSDETLAELLELEAKATPGPWDCGGLVDPGLTFDADVDIYPPDTMASHGFQFGGPVCVVSGRSEGENHNFIAKSRNSLRSIVRELQERRAAEKKEWRLVSLIPHIHQGMVKTEAEADKQMARWPDTWKKQYRIAAGPWIDAEPARAEKEGKNR